MAALPLYFITTKLSTLIWYTRRGNTVAMNRLGDLYREGNVVEQDYSESLKWYRLAADKGDPHGQNNLGSMYLNALGVEQNAAEAVKWYRLAAEQGEPAAQYNLAVRYREGDGVPLDIKESAKWMKKSARQCYTDAKNDWGVMLKYGNGVRKNHVEAALNFVSAARCGDVVARGNLMDMVVELKIFAQSGSHQAAYALGMIYRYGLTDTKDNVIGAAWFRAALKIKQVPLSLGQEMYPLSKLLSDADTQRSIQLAEEWTKDCLRNVSVRPSHL